MKEEEKKEGRKPVSADVQRSAQIKLMIMLAVALALFGAARVSSKRIAKQYKENIITNKYEFDLNGIKLDNYHFISTITIDDNVVTYEGDRYQDSLLYSDKENLYYKNKDKYYKKVDDKWVPLDMNHNLMDFMNFNNIEEMLNRSLFDSKTEYQSKKSVYRYKILTASLISIYEDKHIDIADDPNTISLQTSNSKTISEINYDLSSYGKYQGYGNSVLLKIEYSSFGTIEEISEQV